MRHASRRGFRGTSRFAVRAFAAVSAALLALAPLPAGSTTVESLSEEQMLSRSECVFWGDCLDSRAEWSPDHQRIYTRVRFAPREMLKGKRMPLVELLVPGGELDGKAYVIHGMPRLQAGAEVVLFASEPHPKSKVCVPVGLGQGVYFVQREGAVPQAKRDLRDLRVLKPGESQSRPGRLEVVELDALLNRLRVKARGAEPR